jgi:predicted dehydrogenase
MNDHKMTRKAFLASAGAAVAAATYAPRVNAAEVVPGKKSPNEKLNIAAVGVGGMGRTNLGNCIDENIVALCDVDDAYAAPTYLMFPEAKRFKDYRKMFDAEAKNIDGVIVATPDHTHAVICMTAFQLGKHVYCQKPLAHNIHEVRKLTEAAREYKVQTQLGNQGNSSDNTRRLCEWIEAGAIGPVREVHAWTDRPAGGDKWTDFPIMARPEETPEVPPTLDWDLWLGPAQYRPYHPVYTPISWRGWRAFGTGPIGDIGCHVLDPSFMALKLGHPEWVEATTTHWEKDVIEETYPRASIIRFQFPARGGMPPVKVTWYDGRLKPFIPEDFEPGRTLEDTAAFLLGDHGTISHSFYGASDMVLLPEARAQEFKEPPETLPRVEGQAHEKAWIRACKEGTPASAHFDHAGPLNEMLLLGVIAMYHKEQRLYWDGLAMRFTNCDEANALVAPPYREGWSL